MKRGVA